MPATKTKNPPEVLHEYQMHCHAVLMGRPNKDFTQFESAHGDKTLTWPCRINRRRYERFKQRISYTHMLPWLVYPNPHGLMLAAVLAIPHLPPNTLSFRASLTRVEDGKLTIYVRRNVKKDNRFVYVNFEVPTGLLLPDGLNKYDRVEGMAMVDGSAPVFQLLTINKVGEVD